MDPTVQWRDTLTQIQTRMDRQTFGFLLHGSWPLELPAANGDGLAVWHIAVRNPAALVWLEKQWQARVDEIATSMAGSPVTIAFEAALGPPPEPPAPAAGRLDPPAAAAPPHPEPEPRAGQFLASSRPRASDSRSRPAGNGLQAGPNRSPTPQPLGAFDVEAGGWLKLPLYAVAFWWELIGPVAAAIWLLVRSADKRRQPVGSEPLEPWTPAISVKLDHLARLLAAGSRQTVAGAWHTCNRFSPDGLRACRDCSQRDAAGGVGPVDGPCRYRQPGALDVLEAEGLARVDRGGSARNASYQVSVLRSFPLLSPQQAGRLHPATQARHEHWLLRNGVNLDRWRSLAAAEPAELVLDG